MSNQVRERALRVLEEHENASSSTQIHNAVIDLRRNAEKGDEKILYPFLDHPDAMVVAATLYTLFDVHSMKHQLRGLVEKLVGGDPRDDMAMPIQTTAISLLARFGREDASAVNMIALIAEQEMKNDAVDACAWKELAEMHGLEWLGKYTDELMMNPDSVESEEIRNRVRNAMRIARSAG